MLKCEFSETQFFIGYTRELFNRLSANFRIYAPSTRDEKLYAADLIMKYYGKKQAYKFSVYYQFKRSHLFNEEIFSSLRGGITLNTKQNKMYGFNIYNTSKTKQFNVLKRLATRSRCRVYYCAPLFHTITKFNRYFDKSSIKNNSMLFDLADTEIQKIRIPLNSNHKIIFDKNDQYICSDPIRIKGSIANEILLDMQNSKDKSIDFISGINLEIENLLMILSEEKIEFDFPSIFNDRYLAFFYIREWLLKVFDIHWFPIFESDKNVS